MDTPRVPLTRLTNVSISRPFLASTSRSGPNNLTAELGFHAGQQFIHPVAMGCEKENNNPGCTDSFSSIRACSSWRLRADVHSATGFNPT